MGLIKPDLLQIRIVVTEHAKHFFNQKDIHPNAELFTDSDEWQGWSKRGDPVLHIELSKWADIFVIAPLDANTLAKIANVCFKYRVNQVSPAPQKQPLTTQL